MNFLRWFLGVLGCMVALSAQTLTQVRDTGPRANRINLVFLAEGYTAAEQAKFNADVARLVPSLLNDESWNRFADHVNVFAIFVASNQSGYDHLPGGIIRDTYFNAQYDGRMLLTIFSSRVYALLTEHVPDYDNAVVLVNSGAGQGSASGPIATLTADGDIAVDLLLHELGHSFAGLADEYLGGGSGGPRPANVSTESTRERLPWAKFIAPTTPVPTPDPPLGTELLDDRVGAFAGAYSEFGHWRATFRSKMRDLLAPFGAVNLRAFADQVHRLNLNSATAPPTITESPVGALLAVDQAHTLRVRASGVGPLTYQWLLDGRYLAGATRDSYTVTASTPAAWGTYSVEVTNAAGFTTSVGVPVLAPGSMAAPVVAALPPTTSVAAGDALTLSANASGVAPLSYQWLKDGVPLAGATHATLTLGNLQAANAGVYAVVVTNIAGSVTSGATTVALNAAHPSYTLVDLGMAPGANGIQVADLNESGQVVGSFVFPPGTLDPSSVSRPFLYVNGTPTLLPLLPGDRWGNAYGINGAGQIVGNSSSRAVLWTDGTLSVLPQLDPALPAEEARARAINDLGQIVGVARSLSPTGVHRAFLYVGGTMTNLGVPAGDPPGDPGGVADSAATDLNRAGQIIGQATNLSDLRLVEGGWIYSGGAMSWMPRPAGYPASRLEGINGSGVVAGTLLGVPGPAAPRPNRAFTYAGGVLSVLDLAPGFVSGAAHDINDAGHVVGSMQDSSGRSLACLYVNGTPRDLNAMVALTGTGIVSLQRALKINNRGQIAGIGVNAAGEQRGFLLSPTSAPPEVPANTISFPGIPDKRYGDGLFRLDATANSGLPVVYEVLSGPATIADGNGVLINGAGLVTVRATQPGTATVPPAFPVTRTFRVLPRPVTFTISDLVKTYDGGTHRANITPQPEAQFIVYYNGRTDFFAPPGAPADYAWSVYPWTVGDHEVRVEAVGPNYTGSATATLRILPAPVQVTLSGPLTVRSRPSVTTNPSEVWTFDTVPQAGRLAPPVVTFTFNGSGTHPNLPGIYDVVATVATYGYTGSATARYTIEAEAQTVAFEPIGDRTFGSSPFTLSARGSILIGPIVFSVVSGPATISGNVVTLTGAGTVTVEARQPGDERRAPGVAQQTFNVARAAASVALGSLAQTADGSPKTVTVATQPAGLPVTITYAGSATPPSAPGSYAVVATVNDPNYAGTASGTLVLAPAAPATQTIAFTPISPRTFGDPAFAVEATASSGLPVAISVASGPARISGNTVTLTGAGTVTLQATQAGNASFAPAAATASFTVNRAPAGVTLGNLAQATDGTAKAVSVVTTPAGLPVAITYNGSSAAPSAAGSYAVVATVTDGNYNGSASGTLVLSAASLTPQTIAFAPLGSPTFGDAPLVLQASASSGLPVTLSLLSGPATLSGNTLTLSGAGPVVVQATQSGNTTFSAVTTNLTFTVNKATATIVFGNLAATFDGAPKPVNVTTTPAALPTTITYDGSSITPSAVGSYAVVATIDSPNYVGTVSGTLVISSATVTPPLVTPPVVTPPVIPPPTSPAGQTIAFGPLPNRTFGDASFELTATSSSGLAVSFTIENGPATASGNRVTLTGAGTVTIRAAQAGNASFAPASATQSFTVARASATVAIAHLNQTADGSPKTVAITTIPEGLRTVVTYGGFVTPPTAPGAYVVTVTIDEPNYAGAATGTLTVIPLTATGGETAAGAYFGSLPAPAGERAGDVPLAADAGNSFAVLVRPNRTAVFLGYAAGKGYVARFAIAEDGSFATIAEELGSSTPGPLLRGKIVGGELTGSLVGVSGTFSARAGALPARGRDGFYTAETLGIISGATYLIVGGDARVFALSLRGGKIEAALGTFEPDGSFRVALPDAALSGTIDPVSGAVVASSTGEAGTLLLRGMADAVPRVRQFVNISTRAHAGAGSESLIAGFVIGGESPKQVLIRGAGPALKTFGVIDALAAPKLTLHAGGQILATNSGWSTAANAGAIADAAQAVGAFAFAAGSADSAILLTLPPGAYTVVTTGAEGGTGGALAEVYDVSAGSGRLLNLSTRGAVGAGEKALIAGVVVTGNVPKKILVRAVGPTLRNFGVAGTLSQPQLRIYEGQAVLAENRGWRNDAAVQALSQQVGAFALPAESADAALVITLNPGAYTAVVTGVGDSEGTALLEVYEAPQR